MSKVDEALGVLKEEEAVEMTASELSDQIFDTLMGNVGMSKHHRAFDHSALEDQYVDSRAGEIVLVYPDKQFRIHVTEVDKEEVE